MTARERAARALASWRAFDEGDAANYLPHFLNDNSLTDEVARAIVDAVNEEREACAKMMGPGYFHLAAAIRARGSK